MFWFLYIEQIFKNCIQLHSIIASTHTTLDGVSIRFLRVAAVVSVVIQLRGFLERNS